MNKIKPWILAARPKTLFAALAPIIIGLSISFSIFEEINYIVAIFTIITSILIQIGSNYANDAYDYLKGSDQNDIRKGPDRMAQSGKLAPKTILNVMYFIFIIALFLGFYLAIVGGWPIIIIGLSSIFFAIIYTGGPFPLGYNGLGDIAVFIFFGIVATFGTVYLQYQAISPAITLFDFIPKIILASCAVGCLNTAILVVNNIRDYKSDKQSYKNTLVVIFGQQFGCFQYSALLLISIICFLVLGILYQNYWLIITMSLSFFLGTFLIRKIFNYKIANLNKALEKTAQFAFLNALLFATSIFINLLL